MLDEWAAGCSSTAATLGSEVPSSRTRRRGWARMMGQNTLLPCQGQSSFLLPSVHGFRICRSPSAPRCGHNLQHRRPLHGRSGLQVHASAVAEPVPLEYLSFSGEMKGTKDLSLRVADPGVATGLVHRYVTLARQNARQGTASTLTRSEVRGGGRKPFAQKGTGNARQGSSRSPLKPGGGVVFGPKPRDWSIKMNKKERRLAYSTAFQNAAESIVVVDDLQAELKQPRTKELTAALQRWGVSAEENALLIVDNLFDNLHLASRNVQRIVTNTIANLSVYDLLRADKIIIETSALAFVQEFYGAASQQEVSSPADESASDLPSPVESNAAAAADPSPAAAAAPGDESAPAESNEGGAS